MDEPTMCPEGCGFYGHAAMGGMCSSCYRKSAGKSTDRSDAGKSTSKSETGTSPNAKPVEEKKTGDDTGSSTAPKKRRRKKSKKKTRCDQCRVRVGATGFTCRCTGLFCDKHRYSDAHDCSFDYVREHQARLAAANPKLVGAKLERL